MGDVEVSARVTVMRYVFDHRVRTAIWSRPIMPTEVAELPGLRKCRGNSHRAPGSKKLKCSIVAPRVPPAGAVTDVRLDALESAPLPADPHDQLTAADGDRIGPRAELAEDVGGLLHGRRTRPALALVRGQGGRHTGVAAHVLGQDQRVLDGLAGALAQVRRHRVRRVTEDGDPAAVVGRQWLGDPVHVVVQHAVRVDRADQGDAFQHI